MASLETKLQNQFNLMLKDPAKARITLPKNLRVLETQTQLYSPVLILTRGSELGLPEKFTGSGIIGKIDVIFRYKSHNYVCEIKDSEPRNNSFWYATKASAYCAYLKWQRESTDFTPAVLIPREQLKLEHQIIAGRMGMGLFVFSYDKVNNMFTVKRVEDSPHWKQEI